MTNNTIFNKLNSIHSILVTNGYDASFNFTESSKQYKFNIAKNGIEMIMLFDKTGPRQLVAESSSSNDVFNWSYLVDPRDEFSHNIECQSNMKTVLSNVNDIFLNKRFNEGYLDSIDGDDMAIYENNSNVVTLIDETEDSIIVNKTLLEYKFGEYGILTEFELIEVSSNGFTGGKFINNIECYELKSDLKSQTHDGVIDTHVILSLEVELKKYFDTVIFNNYKYEVTLEIEYTGKEVILK